MPTYEYQCGACGHRFEHFQGITESPLTRCPVCDGKVHRLISSGAGLIFRGLGFYATDYRKDSSRGKKSDSKKGSTDENDGD